MIQRRKKGKSVLLCLTLSLLLVLGCLPTRAMAAQPVDDEKDLSLTIYYHRDNEALAGAKFKLYRIADMDAQGQYTFCDDFVSLQKDVSQLTTEGWEQLSTALLQYIGQNGIQPVDSGRTDEDGYLTFSSEQADITPGLYLVSGDFVVLDDVVYISSPFWISLPMLNIEDDVWLYDVTAEPKSTIDYSHDDSDDSDESSHYNDSESSENSEQSESSDTSESSNTYESSQNQESSHNTESSEQSSKPQNSENSQNSQQDDGEKLVQTGMLWWPVPVLAAAGLLLIVIGFARKKRNDNEA